MELIRPAQDLRDRHFRSSHDFMVSKKRAEMKESAAGVIQKPASTDIRAYYSDIRACVQYSIDVE